jgi:uncharacterized protein YkwD
MNFTGSIRPNKTTTRLAASLVGFGMLAISTHIHAQTPAPGHPTLLRAINAVRQQGCGSGPARASALREDPALSRAAALIAAGRPLQDAMKNAAYRPVRATQITVGGVTGPAALTPKALGRSCASAMAPYLLDAGFHQRGKQTWVVLAEPFSAPEASQSKQVEARVLALVNAARAQPRRCGKELFAAVPPLRLQARLNQVAAGHASEMARHGRFSHTGRDGSSVDQRATRAGYRWRSIGENIAGGQESAELAVQGWLASPGHCANTMAPNFEEMGLAFAVNTQSPLGIYWVQVFGTGR